MSEDDILYALGEGDADRLKRLFGNLPPGAKSSLSPPEAPGTMLGITTSAITARSGSVLGSGTVQAKWIDDSNTLQDYEVLTCLNPGSTIGTNVLVLLFRSGGSWLAVQVC